MFSQDMYVLADEQRTEADVFADFDFDPSYGSGSMLHEPTLDTTAGEELLLGVTVYA